MKSIVVSLTLIYKKYTMKKIMSLLVLIFSFSICNAQENNVSKNVIDSTKPIQIVDAACGQCQFKLPGKGCDLAIRIKGNAYFVDGTSIDEHGDAHANDGFCNTIRKAEVQGELVKDRFKVNYFKLVKTNSSKKE